MIDGGDGTGDVAAFSGAMGRYTVELNADGTVNVVDRQTDGDGTDHVQNVETLNFTQGATIFTDGNLDLSIIEGSSGLSSEQIEVFVELYIAYFNRAPDALGLYFWGSAFANGTTLEETAALFLNQDETRATYPPEADNLSFATQVYSNVLGRIPDQDGLNFWVSVLDSGAVSRDQFILEVLQGAKAAPPDGATSEFIALQQGDQAFLANKTDIGIYYSVIKGLSDVSDASAAMMMYDREDTSTIQDAVDQIDLNATAAEAADSGELLLKLVGVTDDPFAMV